VKVWRRAAIVAVVIGSWFVVLGYLSGALPLENVHFSWWYCGCLESFFLSKVKVLGGGCVPMVG
jgi:hypothetical protein